MRGDLSNALIFISSLLFFITGCEADSNTVNFDYLVHVKMEKSELEIYNQNGRCAVRLNGSPQRELLNISYPCGFVRIDKKLKAQTYYYKGVGQVFVIAGPIVDKSAYNKDSGVGFEHMCSNQGQAIIIHNDKLVLRENYDTPLGFCHYLGFDEKDYYGFAYPVN